jgi:hypothetical protein
MRRSATSSRPSPAMVVAVIALFVALGGSAAALSGKNTVDSGDIINGEVKSKDVENNSLTGTDILESSLGPVPNAADAATLDSLDSSDFGYGITSVSYNPNEAATEYLPGLGSSFGPASATEPSVDLMTALAPLIATDLRVEIQGGLPGNGNNWVITLRDDGVSSGLSCTIVGAVSTTVCTDTTPSSAIGPGSRLALEVVPVGGPNPASAMDIAFRYGPA